MSDVPTRLYKYRAVNEYTARMFTHREIYLPSPLELNDPFEFRFVGVFRGTDTQREEFCRYSVDERNYDERELKKYVEIMMSGFYGPNREYHRAFDTEQVVHGAIRNLGVLSLTTKRDDILMWSHYADSHQGICLEFTGIELGQIRPVIYQREYPTVNLLELTRPDVAASTERAVRTKSDQWRYEREWRGIVKGKGPHRFIPEPLTGIILGCKISEEDEKQVRSWLKELDHEVIVYRAVPRTVSFVLDIVRE